MLKKRHIGRGDMPGASSAPYITPVFLARFNQTDGATPINEIGSVSSDGGAASITSNKLVCNENWRTWAGGTTFDITDNWTLEINYTDQAVHLHETLFGVRDGVVVAAWPVQGRGRIHRHDHGAAHDRADAGY